METQIFLQDCIQGGLCGRQGELVPGAGLQARARLWHASSPAVLPSLPGTVLSVPLAPFPILPWQREKQLLSPHLVPASREVMFRLAAVQLPCGQVAAPSGKWFAGELENCAV